MTNKNKIGSNKDKKFTCLKGMIVVPSPTDKTPVPFFVQVRAKDIIWDESSVSADLVNLAKSGSEFETFNPNAGVRYKSGGWSIEIGSDYTYHASKRLNIVDDGFQIDPSDDTDLLLNLTLPFVSKNDGSFSINCTLNSACEDIASATLSTIMRDGSSSSTFTGVEIHLKNLIYHFDQNFQRNQEYMDSFIFITIDGKMNTF